MLLFRFTAVVGMVTVFFVIVHISLHTVLFQLHNIAVVLLFSCPRFPFRAFMLWSVLKGGIKGKHGQSEQNDDKKRSCT